MKSGDLTAGSAKLHTSWKKLRERWEITQLHWNDQVTREFDENYMQKMEPFLRSTLEIMRGLAELSNAAKQECDPERVSL